MYACLITFTQVNFKTTRHLTITFVWVLIFNEQKQNHNDTPERLQANEKIAMWIDVIFVYHIFLCFSQKKSALVIKLGVQHKQYHSMQCKYEFLCSTVWLMFFLYMHRKLKEHRMLLLYASIQFFFHLHAYSIVFLFLSFLSLFFLISIAREYSGVHMNRNPFEQVGICEGERISIDGWFIVNIFSLASAFLSFHLFVLLPHFL